MNSESYQVIFCKFILLDELPLALNFFITENTERWGLVALTLDESMKVMITS